jgi:cobalamin biosynthesis protein CobD/CbiB
MLQTSHSTFSAFIVHLSFFLPSFFLSFHHTLHSLRMYSSVEAVLALVNDISAMKGSVDIVQDALQSGQLEDAAKHIGQLSLRDKSSRANGSANESGNNGKQQHSTVRAIDDEDSKMLVSLSEFE